MKTAIKNLILCTLTFILGINPTHSQEKFTYLTQLKSLNSVTGSSIDSTSISESSDLYQQIADEFNLTYEEIGKREALLVIANNSLTVTGGLNSIGFSYKKPFINFGVSVDRNLAPDLFDDKRWIDRKSVV